MCEIRGILFGLLFVVLGFWGPVGVWAQEKPKAVSAAKAEAAVPVMAELDSLKLVNQILERDNLALQIRAAQAELDKLSIALSAKIAGYQKPGYDLTQNVEKKFVYVAKTPEK